MPLGVLFEQTPENLAQHAREMAELESRTWWNDYLEAYRHGEAGLRAFLDSRPEQRYVDYTATNRAGHEGMVQWFVDRRSDRELFGIVPVSAETYQRIGEYAGAAAVVGISAGAIYGLGSLAGYFGAGAGPAAAPAAYTEGGYLSAAGGSSAPVGAGVSAGAGVDSAAAYTAGAYGGFDTAAVSAVDIAAEGLTTSALGGVGAAELEAALTGVPFTGYGAGAQAGAAVADLSAATAAATGSSLLSTIREVGNLANQVYSTGKQIFSFLGGSQAASPRTGYAPSLVNPQSTGGMFGSIYPFGYPGGGFGGGGFLPGTGADEGGTLTDFIKRASGMAGLLAAALIIGGIFLFLRKR